MKHGLLATAVIFALMFALLTTGNAEEAELRIDEKTQPLFISNCDFAPGYASEDENPDCYFPAGTPFYRWADHSDYSAIPAGYFLVQYLEHDLYIPAEFLSTQDTDQYPPVFVDYCDEWISIRKKPNYASERIAQLKKGKRIDHWKVYDSEFLYVEVDGYFGYVALDYVRFICFAGEAQGARIGKCNEWVSLRAEADSESERIKKIFLDEPLEMAQRYDNDFYICSVNGLIGYIYDYYIVRD